MEGKIEQIMDRELDTSVLENEPVPMALSEREKVSLCVIYDCVTWNRLFNKLS